METKIKLLETFLEATSNNGEFDLFKSIFANSKEKFAVIKISGKVLESDSNEIAKSIAFLNSIGIFPSIVHGAGSALDKKLKDSQKIKGVRVTKKEDIPIIAETFNEIALDLEKKINSFGGSAKAVGDLFECNCIKEYGFVGEIKKVNGEKITSTINQNFSPIISPIGNSVEGKLNINADSAAKSVVKTLLPKKYILLTETGGILDEKGELIPFINLSSEDAFEGITGGMLLKAKEAKDFLESNKGTEVVITSPKNILYELFTVKGKGTLLKYHELAVENDFSKIDEEKLKETIEDAFKKKLKSGYFSQNITQVIYEKSFGGLAMFTKMGEFDYLDKFAVKKEFQGTGLGKSIWLEIKKNHPSFVWRANPKNPINAFYLKNCDGFKKCGAWNVYWNGLSLNDVAKAVLFTVQKKPSFIEVEK